MRPTQYVAGLQLVFPDAVSASAFTKDLALKFNSKRSVHGKDLELHKTKAHLFAYKTGLILCWCEDAQKRGYKGEIYVTVPYIIVDDKKIEFNHYLEPSTDRTQEERLVDFIRTYWAGNPEPLTVAKKRVTKSTRGQFPKLLSDLVSTLTEFYHLGMSTSFLDGKMDIPDYKMSIYLKKMVADTLKETDKYYEFLETVRTRSETMALYILKQEEAVQWLKDNEPKIYDFLNNRGYLIQEGSEG